MPAAADIVYYGAANHAENNTGTQGGAIDLTRTIILTKMAASGTIEVLSSNSGDTTQTVTVYGRLASGEITSHVYNLNGTTVVTGGPTFERFLKAVKSANTAGTVTVRRTTGPTTICTLVTTVLEARTLFYDIASDPSATRTAYEKFFAKNTHGTQACTNARLVLTQEAEASLDFLMAVEDAINDNNSSANRLTAPTGQSTFRDVGVEENVPGTVLDAGEAIGIWIQMDLDTANAAFVDDFAVELRFASV